MKRLMMLAVAVFALTLGLGQAQAAEKQLWAGPYVGVSLGQASGDFKDAYGVEDPKGIIGGVEIGHLWRKGNAVFGVAGNLLLADINGETTTSKKYSGTNDYSGPYNYTVTVNHTEKATLDRLWTIRSILGYSIGNNWLLYGTGGLALARVKTGSVTTYTGSENDQYSSDQVRNTFGYVFGAGLGYHFPNSDWSIRGEYLQTELQGMTDYSSAVAKFSTIQGVLQYNF